MWGLSASSVENHHRSLAESLRRSGCLHSYQHRQRPAAPRVAGFRNIRSVRCMGGHGMLSEAHALGTRPRPKNHLPVELTIADRVPDVMDFVVSVKNLAPGELLSQ